LGKTLGIGSFCKVRLAVHERTGIKVAIKILNRDKLNKMDMGEKVRTEIHILRQFTHPHIIRLYEVLESTDDIYSVMEYVPGGELFDYIVSRGRLDEREARRLFQQIVSGVEYCHAHGVVHRDLKPENILLDSDNSVKIADFGLSNKLEDGYFLKTSCGSPNYAAPEVISGNLYAGPEVDVWSCGVILYAILCGSLPFDDENIRNLFRKIKGGIYSIPSYVSPAARDLITKMLIVDPLKRITIAEIRKHPWFRQNLASYLALSAHQQIERTQNIDESIVKKVVASGYSRDRLLASLGYGYHLLTSPRMANRSEEREMALMYSLLLDQKRKLDQNKDDIISESEVKVPASPMDELMQLQNYSLSLPVRSDAARACAGRWHLGRWAKDDPQKIMNEVYRVLKLYNFEWKVQSLYRVKARYPVALKTPDGRPCDVSQVLKLSIQVYKNPRNLYVVDIQKVYGQTFLFLDLCGRMTAEWRITHVPVTSA